MVKGGFGLLGGLVSDVREKRGGSCGHLPIYFDSGKRIVFLLLFICFFAPN